MVNVCYLDDIRLWYGYGYELSWTDRSKGKVSDKKGIK